MDRRSSESSSESADRGENDLDAELERRKKALRDSEIRDIQVIPGDPLPPAL